MAKSQGKCFGRGGVIFVSVLLAIVLGLIIWFIVIMATKEKFTASKTGGCKDQILKECRKKFSNCTYSKTVSPDGNGGIIWASQKSKKGKPGCWGDWEMNIPSDTSITSLGEVNYLTQAFKNGPKFEGGNEYYIRGSSCCDPVPDNCDSKLFHELLQLPECQ